jgi:hypothetical protein
MKSYKDYINVIYTHYLELDDLVKKFENLVVCGNIKDYLVDRKECAIYFNANEYKHHIYDNYTDLVSLYDTVGKEWEVNCNYKYSLYKNKRMARNVMPHYEINLCIIIERNKRDVIFEKVHDIEIENLFMHSASPGVNHRMWINPNEIELVT